MIGRAQRRKRSSGASERHTSAANEKKKHAASGQSGTHLRRSKDGCLARMPLQECRGLKMTADTPATRRKFAGQWDEISYLHDKLLYWMYEREDARRAEPFARRLERALRRLPKDDIAILSAESRALIAEWRGDLGAAIRHRE